VSTAKWPMTLATEPTNANEDDGDDAADNDNDNTYNKNSLLLKCWYTRKGQLQEQYKNIKKIHETTTQITHDE